MAKNVKVLESISEIKPLCISDIPERVDKYAEYVAEVAAARGDLNRFMKKVQTEDGFDLRAFKDAIRLDKLKPLALARYLETFDAMRAKRGWDDQMTLPGEGDPYEGDSGLSGESPQDHASSAAGVALS